MFLYEVPFVDDDNTRPAVLDDRVGDLFVLPEDARLGIEHEHGDVAARDRILGALHAEELDGIVDTPRLAHPRGIDKHPTLASAFRLDFERHVDGIASRARDRADNHA